MEKIEDYIELVKETIKFLREGKVVVCSIDKNNKPNLMTIGWGSIGIVWGEPVFIIFIRPSRYTYELIEQTGDFTLNVFDDKYKDIINYCGTVSGRNIDKFKETKLTPLKSKYVRSPLVEESIISYECKVIGKIDIKPEMIAKEIKEKIYKSGDYHRLYIGKILTCYKKTILDI
ncbi:MAG: flavin reductase family protein [bacterium]|nr:flavin reductase family protein [bacterium]